MPDQVKPFFEQLNRLWQNPDQVGRVLRDEPMALHTTFRVGGPADLFFEPVSTSELSDCLRIARAQSIPVTILGNGSNVVVSDAGIRGLVISLGDAFAHIQRVDHTLVVQAGAKLSSVAAFAAREGLGGMAFASGIPGTIGGAVMMNAGAYDHCMGDIIVQTRFLDADLSERVVSGGEHEFSYRHSCFKATRRIITETVIMLYPAPVESILAEMSDLAARRRASQPLEYPSAGSAFKRPSGYFAGKLIADSGLKGFRIGGAEVSDKHAGFIINREHATATDVARLFHHVRSTVQQQFAVRLEPEVRFIGDWSGWQESEVIPWKS